ncbi:hypothetical protein C2U70_06975 [Bradyrhizobium guangdongense]|nr:hypothetical protein C2U70_06975 [Bradyrhizobium guangdongense]
MVSLSPISEEIAGAIVNTEGHLAPACPAADQRGFTTEDILWAVGIWSVILTLSPVIMFYVLMVA